MEAFYSLLCLGSVYMLTCLCPCFSSTLVVLPSTFYLPTLFAKEGWRRHSACAEKIEEFWEGGALHLEAPHSSFCPLTLVTLEVGRLLRR
jgi:hypothetical protein